MNTVKQILARLPARSFPTRAAYRNHARILVVAVTGRQPFAAIEDTAGNCLVCGESGRCPGWHLEAEFKRAGVEPFVLEASA